MSEYMGSALRIAISNTLPCDAMPVAIFHNKVQSLLSLSNSIYTPWTDQWLYVSKRDPTQSMNEFALDISVYHGTKLLDLIILMSIKQYR